jgi:hypothetical protein
LQEARPYIKRITAPLLSLMLRKQLATLGGISQEELDSLFEIKSLRKSVPPIKAVSRVTTSLMRKLILRIMAAPDLAAIIDPVVLADAQLVKGTSEVEFKALQQQIQTLKNGHKIANWVEYFRGTEFEGLFAELEKELLSPQILDPGELKSEFLEFWQGLLAQINRAQATAIAEKSRIQPLTVEEGAELLRHHQAIRNTTQK